MCASGCQLQHISEWRQREAGLHTPVKLGGIVLPRIKLPIQCYQPATILEFSVFFVILSDEAGNILTLSKSKRF